MDLTRYAWYSIVAALATMALKSSAYLVTGSVGMLSDALESIVNLVAACMTLWVLHFVQSPPDVEHAYGHEKAEYFSSGVEGTLIMVAAGSIGIAAWPRFLHPKPLEEVSLGLGLALLASLINGGVAFLLVRAGKKHRSLALEADGHHLLTDVWSSLAVFLGVVAIQATGWPLLDPILAVVVALYLAFTGIRLVYRSSQELLDHSLTPEECARIEAVLSAHALEGVDFHALRTRRAGRRNFVEVHVLVPGAWSVSQGHKLLERIEAEIARAVPGTRTLTHLEPVEDPESFDDIELDRF